MMSRISPITRPYKPILAKLQSVKHTVFIVTPIMVVLKAEPVCPRAWRVLDRGPSKLYIMKKRARTLI